MSFPEPSSFVLPGQCLSSTKDHRIPGKGTYLLGDYIYSSLVGYVNHIVKGDETVIEVDRGVNRVVMPTVGDVVTARVISVRRKYCKCAIICVNDVVLKEPFRAMIRREDVREKDKDKIEMQKCFRSGDVILAKVKAMGVGQWHMLTTAENELGVVLTKSEAGHDMVPASWTEMMCTKTFDKEPRKVARIVAGNFAVKTEDNT